MNEHPSNTESDNSAETELLAVDKDPPKEPVIQRISYERPQIREVDSPIEETEEEYNSDHDKEEDKGENYPKKSDIHTDSSENMSLSAKPSQNTSKIFMDAILQRKKNSFDSFQSWEQQRADKINHYRGICENILERIESRISASIEGTEGLLRYFTERRNQEELYYTVVTKNLRPTGNLFSEKFLKDSGDWSLPKILREYDEYHERQMKSSQELAFFIQNTIIKDILLNTQKDSLKKLLSIRQKISDTRKKIQEINKRIEKRGAKYSSLAARILNQENDSKKDVKDLYSKELSMIAYAQQQTEGYEAFGRVVLEFWDTAEATESLRYKSIQHALSLFIDKLAEVYGESYGKPQTLRKLLEKFEPSNEASKLFTASSLLNADKIEYIKYEMGILDKNILMEEAVVEFLEYFPFEPPATKPLVLKEWEAQKVSGSFKSFRPCSLLVTIDGNLIIVDRSEEGIYKKAEAVIKFSQILVHEDAKQTNPLILQIVELIPGLIFDTKKKFTFKFSKTDHVDEILQYLNRFSG